MKPSPTVPRLPRRATLALAALTCVAIGAGCATADYYDEGGGSRVDYEPWSGTGRGGHTVHIPDDPGGLAPARWEGVVTERCREVEPLMRVAAMEHRVDIGLIAGIIHVESHFNATAKSRSGARGLMQVMPSVGRRLKCGNLTDPKRNIQCGVTILKRFLARYDDRVIFGLSAYNAGYKIPNDALEDGELPANYSYVEKVLASRVSYLRYGCGH